jgi:hypothetical protein
MTGNDYKLNGLILNLGEMETERKIRSTTARVAHRYVHINRDLQVSGPRFIFVLCHYVFIMSLCDRMSGQFPHLISYILI